MRIILARHGETNHGRTGWISPREMADWIRVHDEADLTPAAAPQTAIDAATTADLIVSSTLRRAVQTAQRLPLKQPLLSEAVFCEADLPYPDWRWPKLPVSTWTTLFRLAWFCGYSNHAESRQATTARAQIAADRLIALAQEHGKVLLVCHGIMINLIAKQLIAKGWAGPALPAHDYWQFSAYHPEH